MNILLDFWPFFLLPFQTWIWACWFRLSRRPRPSFDDVIEFGVGQPGPPRMNERFRNQGRNSSRLSFCSPPPHLHSIPSLQAWHWKCSQGSEGVGAYLASLYEALEARVKQKWPSGFPPQRNIPTVQRAPVLQAFLTWFAFNPECDFWMADNFFQLSTFSKRRAFS